MAEIVIKVTTEGGEKSLKNINDLKSAITQLETESANLDLGSEAFEKSKAQIDELKKKYAELAKSQQQLDAETADKANKAVEQQAQRAEKIGNNVQKFAAGLTDAFAGAFIALGASEKDAAKLNATLQQGVGIALGVKGGIEAIVAGVELAGPAFEAFNAIIAANPIGAVVIAVAALTAGVYLLVKAINSEEKESEKLTKSLEKQKAAADLLKAANANETTILEAKIGLMKAQGASSAEILKAENDLYNAKRKGLEQDLVQLKLAANVTKAKLVEVLANESLTESYFKTAAALARSLGQEKEARIYEFAAKQEKLNNSKEVTDQLQKDLTAVAELKTELTVLDLQHKTALATADTKGAADAKKIREDLKNERDQQLKDDAERLKAELDLINKGIAEQHAALEAQRESEIDDNDIFYARKHSKAIKAAEDDLIGDRDNLTKKRALLEQQRQEEIRIARLKGEDIAAINKKYVEADEALVDESFKKKIAKVNIYTQAVGSALTSVVGAFQAYADLQRQNEEQDTKERQAALDTQLTALNDTRDAELAKEGLTNDQKIAINNKYAQQEYELKLLEYNRNTEVKKKAFEQDKKLKIAQTVISTITGAVSALTGSIQALGMPYGAIVGAIAAAAVVATGAVQVAAIQKQKFDAGSPPAPPKIQVPTDNSGGDSAQPGAQAGPDLYAINGDTNTGQGGSGKRTSNNNNEPIRAYVVTEDISASQNKNAVIERRSSF